MYNLSATVLKRGAGKDEAAAYIFNHLICTTKSHHLQYSQELSRYLNDMLAMSQLVDMRALRNGKACKLLICRLQKVLWPIEDSNLEPLPCKGSHKHLSHFYNDTYSDLKIFASQKSKPFIG